MRGALVKEVQRRLRALGFHAGPIDGIYGPQTAAAVQGLQMSEGLVSDGPPTARRHLPRRPDMHITCPLPLHIPDNVYTFLDFLYT
jgi:peptidoglycan hydrolase-like protein with peptidoglycan-binding domain